MCLGAEITVVVVRTDQIDRTTQGVRVDDRSEAGHEQITLLLHEDLITAEGVEVIIALANQANGLKLLRPVGPAIAS